MIRLLLVFLKNECPANKVEGGGEYMSDSMEGLVLVVDAQSNGPRKTQIWQHLEGMIDRFLKHPRALVEKEYVVKMEMCFS